MKNVFMNRELSWLKFNERVLEEAERECVPLCERLSFASIYQSNLDEFFMVRVGSLTDQMEVDPDSRENKTNMTAKEQLKAVIARVGELNERKNKIYADLMKKIAEQGVALVDFSKLTAEENSQLEQYFLNQIAPLLSPMVVGKDSLSLSLKIRISMPQLSLKAKIPRRSWVLSPAEVRSFQDL